MFEVVAADGRRVCLHEDWLHEHILGRKPEIARLTNPVQEIEHALTHATEVRPSTTRSDRLLYIGPAIGHGFFGNDCLHVIVQQLPDDRGFVVTVVMRRASAD